MISEPRLLPGGDRQEAGAEGGRRHRRPEKGIPLLNNISNSDI